MLQVVCRGKTAVFSHKRGTWVAATGIRKDRQMADLEQTLREIFGESVDRLSRFQADQIKRLNDKVRELARESIRDDLARLEREIAELKSRITALERK